MTVEIVHQPDLFSVGDPDYRIEPIDPRETYPFLLEIHYAKRIPSISHSFGLIREGDLRGVITYGLPPSPTLCRGIAGPDWTPKVIELNRLCLLNNDKNEASRLVGGSLKLLPKPTIVVSFADTAQDHLGVIYQATNFLYTGRSAKRTEWVIEGMEDLHSKSISDLVQGSDGRRIDALREMFGDRLTHRDRSSKHRYIYLVGSKSDRRAMRRDLRYPILPYPKRDSHD